ncbi:DMT family transporter [Nisaea acidiphila]|uniref:DMT family transporter n=1 Tax=Nisaea acidiphila TaxID=1862145 RepID=A0A9J7AS72_9PROT|nr:DMT family transporter [Nisaea acidiphila]UUX50111.1 DMT family transporter [Nisaea acidiphila]
MLGALAATTASFGWAAGMVLAHGPAQQLGAFEFTRIQLLVAGLVTGLLVALLGQWPSVNWQHWPSFLVSISIGVILGNLAMVECLRRGGPRNAELVISLKAPIIAAMAYFWYDETLEPADLAGGLIALGGVSLAVTATHSNGTRGSVAPVLFFGLASALCQGIGFLCLKPAMQSGTEPMALGAVRLLGASLLVSLAGLWHQTRSVSAREVTPNLLFRTILPGLMGYSFSTPLLLYAFAHTQAGVAAVLGSLAPVLILPLVWIVERQRPSPRATAGALLAVTGAAIIVLV